MEEITVIVRNVVGDFRRTAEVPINMTFGYFREFVQQIASLSNVPCVLVLESNDTIMKDNDTFQNAGIESGSVFIITPKSEVLLSDLEPIICQIDNPNRATNSSEKIIVIDTNTGQQKRSFFAKNIKYYLIRNSKDESNFFNYNGLICRVQDFENDFNLDLKIDYRVSCEPGNEIKVAESLWDSSNPRQKIDRKIQTYIDVYFTYEDRTSNIISNFPIIMPRLKKSIIDEIDREIGLHIKLRITLPMDN